MNQSDIERMAVELAAFAQLLEQRSEQVVQQSLQATQAMQHSAQDAASTSQRISAQAVDEFRQAIAGAIQDGMCQPLEAAKKTLHEGMFHIETASQSLDARMRAQHKVYAANAWKVFIACALASVTVIGVAVYMSVQARQEMARAEWISQVNAAIANGKLGACAEGGVCAYIDKKAVRLDH